MTGQPKYIVAGLEKLWQNRIPKCVYIFIHLLTNILPKTQPFPKKKSSVSLA